MDITQTPGHRVSLMGLVALGTLGAIALPGPVVGQGNDKAVFEHDPAVTAYLDIGGSGNFTGVIEPAKDQLCYILNAPLDGATHAAIVDGKGKPLVMLATPDEGGASGGCAAISPEAVKALVSDADDYAVEIDTKAYKDEVHAPLRAIPGQA